LVRSFVGYGMVTAVRGNVVTIVLTRGYLGSVRTLHIQPSTVVAEVGGGTVTGQVGSLQVGSLQVGSLQVGSLQVGSLQVGNDVYFTGATDTPGPRDTTIWAYRVVQLGEPTVTPQLPATGAGGVGAGGATGLGLAALLLLSVLSAARLSRVQLRRRGCLGGCLPSPRAEPRG